MRYDTSELKEGEVFIGNVPTNFLPRPYLSSLNTLRTGKQAFDINGEKIAPDYCLPVFIHRSELDAYDKIMMAEIAKIRRD